MHWSKKTSSSDRIPLTQFDTGFTLDYMMELSKINIFWEHAEGMCQDFSCTSSRMLSLTITFCFAGDSPGQESLGPIQQAWHWDDHYKSRKVTTTRYFNSKSYASFLLVWYLWWGIAVGRGNVSWTLWPFSQIKSLLISYPTVQWPGSHILNVFDCNGVISDMIVVLGV